jgi:glyoxylase-like metal-dependent hydrolase (beta-lactamase superfamily II)
MIGIVQVGIVMQMLLVGAGRGPDEFINIEKLSNRVLLAYWVGTDRRCNLTTIQSQKGLVIIDTEMSPRIMAPIKAKIERVVGRSDWTYVINTHAHDSHAGGNSLFPGATIVGHENVAAEQQPWVRRQTEPDKSRVLAQGNQLVGNLRAYLPQVARNRGQTRLIQGEIKFAELYMQDVREGYPLVPPTVTFADQHTIELGDLTLELYYFGKGHSNCDILIYVPQERLLVTGGVIYTRACVPEVAEETTLQDVHRYLAVLDRFAPAEVKIDHVVPGHSMPLEKKDLLAVRDYYRRMLAGVQAAQQEGLTLEQTMSRLALKTNFPAFRDPPAGWSHGFHERSLKNLWRILKEEQKSPTEQGKSASLAPAPVINRP